MPRRSGSSSRSTASPSRSTATAARPAPQTQAPPQAPARSGGMFSGLGSTLMQGMAFGAGSEVAHQAIRSVMGGSGHSQAAEQPAQQQAPQQQQQTCQSESQMFSNCLQTNQDITRCQPYMDIFKECQKKYNL
ncbi:unnamed protein product (macronuclear) [Paramecium tetraurelia]|uniref:CHCH domain-containing protein n=2 Tax=Paramecium TaxID=5884 RepID=A0D8R7_PARTE|nr:uncharacterized protein GSPATT00014380001 [Paramecium tetraurelia]CAD8176533.1 unnamed protein product [Paramecium octaurelia]CAK79434.1 unnamed protein product [Paramecium tetraurelia]|eukprot:XP_001446831.1 hypothetical protein (macronuclear) [Paramecium tetraurelia strain d4-2]